MLETTAKRRGRPTKPLVSFACSTCGKVQWATASKVRQRQKRNKMGIFCSRGCVGIAIHRNGLLPPPSRGATAKSAIALREQNPCLTMSEIGRRLKVSRQRVFQVLSKAEKLAKLRPKLECPVCHKVFLAYQGRSIQGQKDVPAVFCSALCAKGFYKLEAICDYCGKIFTGPTSEMKRRIIKNHHLFCNKKCQGRWLAANWGFKKDLVRSLATHCKRGHPFSEANTYIASRGTRQCRLCEALRARERRAKEKSSRLLIASEMSPDLNPDPSSTCNIKKEGDSFMLALKDGAF